MASKQHNHRPVLGVTLKLISVFMLAGMTACVKYLGTQIPIGETIFVRGLIATLVLVVFARYTVGLKVLHTQSWQSHARRSLAGTVSMFCLFAALTMTPLAEVTGITFTSPLFITLLAMPFLGEKIHAFRWAALICGFVGVTIIISPHIGLSTNPQPITPTTHSSLGIVAAFSAALFAALAMIFLRKMSGGEHAITITFYFLLTSSVCSLLTLPWGWILPNQTQGILLLLIGLFGVLGQLIMTYAYRYAEASTLAPLDFTNMVLTVAIGYWLFGETPSWSLWLGMPLILISGLLIFWNEYRLSHSSKINAEQINLPV